MGTWTLTLTTNDFPWGERTGTRNKEFWKKIKQIMTKKIKYECQGDV